MFIDTVTVLMLKSKIFIFIINNKLCYIVYIVFDYANSRVYTKFIYSHILEQQSGSVADRAALLSPTSSCYCYYIILTDYRYRLHPLLKIITNINMIINIG